MNAIRLLCGVREVSESYKVRETKKMRESHKYRLRIGKYRLLYEIIDEQILIYTYKAQFRGYK